MSDKRIIGLLPETEILAQMAEEAAELAKAALKLRRAKDGVNPTPVDVKIAEANLIEEYADVAVCVNALFTDEMYDRAVEVACQKQDRWLKRLQERKNSNEKAE